ncbi:UxaA family hydrolase [Bradyrhizobium brasilense]|uniref:UxaA family hydrolase n=1 Tax=Bradyrhizobium brasilense TaxID=1419277 RepID=UPI001AECDCA0
MPCGKRHREASRAGEPFECGGSDGFSGVSANLALGAAMDVLVRHWGAILSETPEIRRRILAHTPTRPAGQPAGSLSTGSQI